MGHFKICLPIYGEASNKFKGFVKEMPSSFLRRYLVQYSQGYLTFLPSVSTDDKKILKKASIKASLLYDSSIKADFNSVGEFASRFNMLASVAASEIGKENSRFTFELRNMGPDSPCRYMLIVTLVTNNELVESTVSNLFKVLLY